MRRFGASARCGFPLLAGASVRTKMTGFNLFTRHMQRQKGVMKAKSLKSGAKQNMQLMSKLWWKLDSVERKKWNAQATNKRLTRVSEPSKRDSAFNLVMRVFAQGDGPLLNAGNESFTSQIAKRTAEALSPKQTATMREKLNVDPVPSASRSKRGSSPKSQKQESAYWRMICPDMKYFSSFTEMQRAVAPTQEACFVHFSSMRAGYHVSTSGRSSLQKKFRLLTLEKKDHFSPISNQEAPAFETFCASKCTTLDPHHFNILSIFGEFRGIAKMKEVPNSAEVALFRSLASFGNVRDGLYNKAHRILLRMREARSSDCSAYIASITSAKHVVPPTAYGVNGGTLSDVDVARMLASTRMNHSVYDDVLQRASVLRSPQGRNALSMYDVQKLVAEIRPIRIVQASSRRSEKVTITGNRAATNRRRAAATAKKNVATAKRSTRVPKKTVVKAAVAKKVRPTRRLTAAGGESEKPLPRLQTKKAPTPVTAATAVKAKAPAKPRKTIVKTAVLLRAEPSVKRRGKPSVAQSPTASPSARAREKALQAPTNVVSSTVAQRSTPKKKNLIGAQKRRPTALVAKRPTRRVASLKAAGNDPAKKRNRVPKPKAVTAAKSSKATVAADEDEFAMERRMLAVDAEDEYLDDYVDDATATPSPQAEAVTESLTTPPRTAGKSKVAKAPRKGKARRRVRSTANLLKGTKEPIVLTSHITPKRRRKGPAPDLQSLPPSRNATVNLLRKQLAGFL